MDLKNLFKREIVYVSDIAILFDVSNNTAGLKLQLFLKDLKLKPADCILASEMAKVTNFTEEYIIDKLFLIDEANRMEKEARKLARENQKKVDAEMKQKEAEVKKKNKAPKKKK